MGLKRGMPSRNMVKKEGRGGEDRARSRNLVSSHVAYEWKSGKVISIFFLNRGLRIFENISIKKLTSILKY